MNKKGWIGVLVSLLFIILLISGIVYIFSYALTDGEEIITVKTKWTKIIDGTEQYRITSINGQTFVIKDSLFHKQFESASIYANIDEEQKYKIRTQGFRFGLFSDFKKITKTTLIK